MISVSRLLYLLSHKQNQLEEFESNSDSECNEDHNLLRNKVATLAKVHKHCLLSTKVIQHSWHSSTEHTQVNFVLQKQPVCIIIICTPPATPLVVHTLDLLTATS